MHNIKVKHILLISKQLTNKQNLYIKKTKTADSNNQGRTVAWATVGVSPGSTCNVYFKIFINFWLQLDLARVNEIPGPIPFIPLSLCAVLYLCNTSCMFLLPCTFISNTSLFYSFVIVIVSLN